MNTYPENDYRNYLMHWGKGGESKNHKYISRKMGKAGKWIYTYANKLSGADAKKRRDLTLQITDQANARADQLLESSNKVDGQNGMFEKSMSARRVANATAANYHDALDKYMKTPLGQFERAKDAGTSLLDKARKAKQKFKNKRNLNKARKDIKKRIAGKHTAATLNDLRSQGRVTSMPSNYGKTASLWNNPKNRKKLEDAIARNSYERSKGRYVDFRVY